MYGRSLLYFSLHSPHVTARRAGHLLLPILIATVCGSSCRRRNLYAKTTTPRMLLSIHSLHISSHSYVIRVRSPLSQTSSPITSRSRSQRIHHNRHRSYKSLTKYTMFSLSLSLSYTLEGSYRIAHYIAALTNHSHALSFTTHTHTHLRSIRRSQTSSARLSCPQARTFSHYYSLSLSLSFSPLLQGLAFSHILHLVKPMLPLHSQSDMARERML